MHRHQATGHARLLDLKRLIIALVLVVPLGLAVGEVAGHLAPRPLTVQQELNGLAEQPRTRCSCLVVLIPSVAVQPSRGITATLD